MQQPARPSVEIELSPAFHDLDPMDVVPDPGAIAVRKPCSPGRSAAFRFRMSDATASCPR